MTRNAQQVEFLCLWTGRKRRSKTEPLPSVAGVGLQVKEPDNVYRLYPLGSQSDPNELWLDYEWGELFDNTEWRPCVEHFLNEVAAKGHEVVALPSPPFKRGEDFVEIGYLLDGAKTTFSSDLLLCLIVITTEDQRVLRGVWNDIGDKLGWTS